MKRAIVAHHYWGQPGGSQLVCASAAYAFSKAGFKPTLVSVGKFDSSMYSTWFGIDLSGYDVFSLFGFELGAFGIYHKFLFPFLVKRAIERLSPDLVFTDTSTYRPIEGLIKRRTKLIEYIHFPFEVSIDPRYRGSGLYYGEDPYILERYRGFPMNLYWWVHVRLLPKFMRENPFHTALAVLTNSGWVANLVEKLYGERPQVLNPPVPPGTGLVVKPKDFDLRERSVVMVGRFSEEKRYHWVVEKLMPRLLKEVEGVRLYIFGSARTRARFSYLDRVERLARRAGLRVSRSIEAKADVYLIADVPRNAVNEALDSSRVFLHATVNEHWGIAVAEAMARGLPTVVHKSGGTWSDLASEGLVGLGYSSEENAVEALAKLLTDEKLWRLYSQRSLERARELTLERFAERLISIVRKVA
ncbi:MAG: glycosyltransferase [Nitrososphaerota archaeon]